MIAFNCSPEVAQDIPVISSCKNHWRILIRHGRNITAKQGSAGMPVGGAG
jgi:hypothetical protein